jgi:hypothetical protein
VDKKAIKEALLRRRTWLRAERAEDKALSDQAEAIPELKELMSEQERFNARVNEALAGIPVPPSLREHILARRKTVSVSFWRTRPVLLAMAAALIILLTGVLFWMRVPTEDQTFAGFRSRMVGFALREYRMDKLTSNLAELKQFLAQTGVPSDFDLPRGLANTPVKGGARLSWQGKPVSMVCFDWKGEKTLYMFVIEEAELGSGAIPTTPYLEEFKRLTTAVWSANGKAFLLAGELPQGEVLTLL